MRRCDEVFGGMSVDMSGEEFFGLRRLLGMILCDCVQRTTMHLENSV